MSPHRIWRDATAEHRRWVFINAVLIAAFINAALSALIAWGSAAGEDEIPLWAAPLVGGPSTVVDTVGTLFILPFLTTLIITTVIWHELREGRLVPLSRPSSGVVANAPPTRLRRGVYFGALTVAVLALPAVLVIVIIDPGDISVGTFVLYKAIFGVVLGAIVTPPIALTAMTDRIPQDEVARPGIEPGTP
jgi:hypothetical protein